MKKIYKRIILVFLILICVIGIVAAVFQITGIYDPDNMIIGDNANATSYTRGIGKKVYKSLEEGLKEKNENYSEQTLLYQGQTGNLVKTFVLDENQVYGYEFLLDKNSGYHYSGERKLVFTGISVTKSFDWKTDVRADLSCSTRKSYKKMINIGQKYEVLPAWGASDTDQVKNMKVDGQAVDHVIEFSKDGETYYLWIIDDLQTENDAKNIKIEKEDKI